MDGDTTVVRRRAVGLRPDTPERATCSGVERKRNEIGLGLLLVRLPRRTLRAAGSHERADRQLGEHDGRDRGFVRQKRWVGELREQDHHVRIDDTTWFDGHSD